MQMDFLTDRLAAVRAEIAKLRAQEEMLVDLIREASTQRDPVERAPRSTVMQTLLDLLEVAGAEGLNVAMAEERAATHGIRLKRGSVASTLSRMKKQGFLVYDEKVYKLKKFAAGAGTTGHPIQTSGAIQ